MGENPQLTILIHPWIYCGLGILFCLTGVYLFYKNIYEEGSSVRSSVLLMVMGVILIGIGTAKYFNLA